MTELRRRDGRRAEFRDREWWPQRPRALAAMASWHCKRRVACRRVHEQRRPPHEP
jgi:hypothetical protein